MCSAIASRLFLPVLTAAFLSCALVGQCEEWALVSPNGQVMIAIALGAGAGGHGQQGKRISYRVEQGAQGSRALAGKGHKLDSARAGGLELVVG